MYAHKFQKIGHSCIIPFVYDYVGKEQIHKYMQYDASMTIYGSVANQRKVSKWLPFKNYKSDGESLNI